MIIDTAQVILDLRFWIAETADGLGRLSFFRTSFVGRGGPCQAARSRSDRALRRQEMNGVRIRRTDKDG